MRLYCREHGYMDEKTGPMAECPYCEIDRLKQYEDAISSAAKGLVLVWNFTDTDCTVVDYKYWVAHLEKIERLEKALGRIATERFPMPTPCRETYLRSIAKEALEI